MIIEHFLSILDFRSYRSTDIEIQLWNQATVKREFSKKNSESAPCASG